MTFELIGYTDTLLRDLGRRSNRKVRFKDIFSPVWAKDFRGLKAEFVEKYGYNEVDKYIRLINQQKLTSLN